MAGICLQKLPERWYVAAEFFRQRPQKSRCLSGAGCFVHETETQHELIGTMNDVVCRDRLRLPVFERASPGRRGTENASPATAGRWLELAAHQSLLLEPLECGINGAGTVAKSSHGSISEDFPQVVTGTRFLVEKPEYRVAKQ